MSLRCSQPGTHGRVTFLPDGQSIASNWWGGSVWDVATGRRRALTGEYLYASGLVGSPDGRRVLALAEKWNLGKPARVFDFATGAEVSTLVLPDDEPGIGVADAGWFSSDGARIATRRADRVHVWESATGRFLGAVRGVDRVAFRPGGTDLLACGQERAVLWSDDDGREVFTAVPGRTLLGASWGAAGPLLAVGVNTQGTGVDLSLLDARTGALVRDVAAHPRPIERAWWSPDATRIVTTCRDGRLRVLDADLGGEVASLDLKAVLALPAEGWYAETGGRWVSTVQVRFASSRGRAVVFGAGSKRAAVLDLRSGGVIATLIGHEGAVGHAALAPDGDRVATTATDLTLRIWDATPGRAVVALPGHTDGAQCVAFSPDGAHVVTTEFYGPGRVWDARTGALVAELGDVPLHLARFSPSGRVVVGLELSDGAEHVHRFDAGTGADLTWKVSLENFGEPVVCADGARVALLGEMVSRDAGGTESAPAEVLVIDTDTGSLVSRFALAAGEGEDEEDPSLLGLDPHGRRVLTLGLSRALMLHDAGDGRVLARLPQQEYPSLATVTPDGLHLLCGEGRDNELFLFDLTDEPRQTVLRGHRDALASLSISADGRVGITSSYDGTTRVWDLTSPRCLYTLTTRNRQQNLSRASPDGRSLVTVATDGAAELWDLRTGELVVHLPQPEGRNVSSGWYEPAEILADFSPDGGRVVTASWSGVVRVFPVDALAAAEAAPRRELSDEERARYLEPLDEHYETLRDARRRVGALFDELLLESDVIARLRADQDLPDAAREAALALAARRASDWNEVADVAWTIALAADRSADDYTFALHLATAFGGHGFGAGDRYAPADAARLLAVVSLRTGAFEDALAHLRRAEEMAGVTSRLLAVRALALGRLGRTAEARADLERARTAKHESSDDDRFIEEAEELLKAAPEGGGR